MIVNSVPKSFELLGKVSNKQFERMLAFDILICNRDRHEGNIIIEMSNDFRMYCIDNSHALFESIDCGSLSNESKVEKLKGYHSFFGNNKNKHFYQRLAVGLEFSDEMFTSEVSRIKQILTKDRIKEAVSTIPKEWISGSEKWREGAMVDVLNYRVNHLSDIAGNLIDEMRDDK